MEERLKQVAEKFWKDHETDNCITGLFIDRKLDPIALRRCLTRATVDITSRTLTVNENQETKSDQSKNIKITDSLVKAFEDAKIYDKFAQWFAPIADSQEPMLDFDTWHHEACELVLDAIKTRYPDAKYGKAQKVINMTFKTMYALVAAYPPAFDVQEYFRLCHMPLDSFTLEWFKSRKCPSLNDKKEVWNANPHRKLRKKSEEIATNYFADTQTAWSNIEWGDDKSVNEYYVGNDEKAKYSYQFYVYEIRNLFCNKDQQHGQVEPEYKAYTPLQAEFFIWEKMQYIRSAREIAAALDKFCKSYPQIRTVAKSNPDLQENITKIKGFLKNL